MTFNLNPVILCLIVQLTGFFIMFNKSYGFESKNKDVSLSKYISLSSFRDPYGIDRFSMNILSRKNVDDVQPDIGFHLPVKDIPKIIKRLEKIYNEYN